MSNVTPIRPDEPGQGSDAFDAIHDGMQGELAALRCVQGVMEASDVVATDESLAAALSLFHRTFRRLEGLHSDLETWRIATKPEARS